MIVLIGVALGGGFVGLAIGAAYTYLRDAYKGVGE